MPQTEDLYWKDWRASAIGRPRSIIGDQLLIKDLLKLVLTDRPPKTQASNVAITFVQSDFVYSPTLAFPTSTFESGYYGPNFEIAGGTSSTVPEPNSIFLLGGCVMGLIAYRRKKRVA